MLLEHPISISVSPCHTEIPPQSIPYTLISIVNMPFYSGHTKIFTKALFIKCKIKSKENTALSKC